MKFTSTKNLVCIIIYHPVQSQWLYVCSLSFTCYQCRTASWRGVAPVHSAAAHTAVAAPRAPWGSFPARAVFRFLYVAFPAPRTDAPFGLHRGAASQPGDQNIYGFLLDFQLAMKFCKTENILQEMYAKTLLAMYWNSEKFLGMSNLTVPPASVSSASSVSSLLSPGTDGFAPVHGLDGCHDHGPGHWRKMAEINLSIPNVLFLLKTHDEVQIIVSSPLHDPYVYLRLSTSLISLSRCLCLSLSLCSLIWSNDRMSFFSLLGDLRSRLFVLLRKDRRKKM